MGFAGSTAYIVNAKSKGNCTIYSTPPPSSIFPMICISGALIHRSALKGFSLFPFVTSLSDFLEKVPNQGVGHRPARHRMEHVSQNGLG